MIKSDGNGSLIIKKTTLLPLGLVLTLLVGVLSASGFYFGMKQAVALNTMHRISDDVHQPFEEKFKMWFSRTEAEEMQAEIKHLLKESENVGRKIDVLLLRTQFLEENIGG